MPYVNNHLYIDQNLTALVQAYEPASFIASELVTRIPVTTPAGTYRVINKENNLTITTTEVGDYGVPSELSADFGTGTFTTTGHALQDRIATSFEKSTDIPGGLRTAAATQLKARMMLAREKRFADLFQATGNYASANVATLVGTAQWSDYANSDPLIAIDSKIGTMWTSPTSIKVAWMGYDVWLQLKNHPKILSRITGGATNANPAMVTRQLVAQALGVDKLLVGETRATSANPGQAAAYNRIWGKNFGIAAVESNASLGFLGFAAELEFIPYQTFEWFEMSPGVSGANILKVSCQTGEKVISNEAAILFANAVA